MSNAFMSDKMRELTVSDHSSHRALENIVDIPR